MFVVASNITTRDVRISRIFQEMQAANWNLEHESAAALRKMAEQCVAAGADALEINLQQRADKPEAMKAAVDVVQLVTDRQLCLSTNKAEVLEAGLKACQRPPLVNYVAIDEARLRDMLPLIANYGAGVVLLVSDPAASSDVREMLQKAAVLFGTASEVGIPDDGILIDPGLIHITADIGQRHLAEVKEFLRAFPEVFDPPVRSTCWLGNASAGAPKRLRPVIETALLPMLAGLGLSSVFMDVLQRENRRTVRLIKIFNNETIYAEGDVVL